MTAHRFFLDPPQWTGSESRLDADEAHHAAKVLRLEVGERIEVFDGRGRCGEAVLLQSGKSGVIVRVESQRLLPPPPVEITLFQALPKGPRMDWLIEKAVEIGVSRFVPIQTERSEVKIRSDAEGGHPARWHRIALSAAKQCGLTYLPIFEPVFKPGDWATLFRGCEMVVVGVLDQAAISLSRAIEPARRRGIRRIGVLIGPEGDLTPGEIEAATTAGAIPVSFGPNTLRVETAAIFALSVLMDAFLAKD